MADYTFLSLCPVFPDTKPYGVLDLEVPGKLPATAWEKGKGSEVSVMLTVSAAAAKVCPRGTLGQRAVFRACLDTKVTTVQIFVLNICFFLKGWAKDWAQ